MPANISKIGFIILLIFSGAYSERKTAVAKPIGTAKRAAMPETNNVPVTNGKTPKL